MANDIKIISSRKIYEVLNSMSTKSHVWLTSKSITALQNFLNGYMQLGYADDIYHPGEPPIEDFQSWLLHRDNEHAGIGNVYSNVLLKECHGNEEAAFDHFFELLDEFRREHITSV